MNLVLFICLILCFGSQEVKFPDSKYVLFPPFTCRIDGKKQPPSLWCIPANRGADFYRRETGLVPDAG